jgi:hypothetical protein
MCKKDENVRKCKYKRAKNITRKRSKVKVTARGSRDDLFERIQPPLDWEDQTRYSEDVYDEIESKSSWLP